MNIEEFELLAQDDKERAVWSNGSFITNLEEDNKICDIYSLYDFYVGLNYELKKNRKAYVAAALTSDSPNLWECHS